MSKIFVLALAAISIPAAWADYGTLTNSGGSTSGGSIITSNVASPAGALTIAGNTLTFLSNDGATVLSGVFSSASSTESCSGGGKGGHISCGYSFVGSFTGTLTTNGVAQAITGVTSQSFPVGGAATGVTSYVSSYSPFYYTDSEQVLRSDDLLGTNQVSYGGPAGSPFFYPGGMALDAAGRIYVADSGNCRITRMDDMNGANFVSYGDNNCGSGPGQFANPTAIAIDSNGKIYVLDPNNAQIVRMDDMTGFNWVSYGSAGSGVGQFASLGSIALDSSNRIYVADTANLRIARFDDMTGTNWTTMSQYFPANSTTPYTFNSPVAVAVDPNSGQICIADNEYYGPAVVRVDDMTGANGASLYVSPTGSGGLNSISVDSTGAVFTGGGGAKVVLGMASVLNSSGSVGPIGSYYVFSVTPQALPAPRPAAISLNPTSLTFSQNIGTTGSQSVTLANFGGGLLHPGTISANGGFTASSNCPATLAGGSNCSVTVGFAPAVTGPFSGTLTVTDDSYNAGVIQTIPLIGTGTAPAASISPSSLSFPSTLEGASSSARTVTITNSGTGPLQVSSVTAAGPFSESNTCSAVVAPAATCTISVTFAPTAVGAASGSLTIADNAGTQTVPLSGAGSAPVTVSVSLLNFGALPVGNTSAASSVTLTNRTSAAISFSGATTTAGFNIATNTCGASLAAGASCAVGVTFSPSAIGATTGTLTFTDAALNSPQTVALSGTGSAPVTLSPTSLTFSTTSVGSTSSSKTVTLTNSQSSVLSFTSITATAGFAVASNTCGTTIAALASCTVGVTFSPTVAGTTTGTLTFTDTAPGGSQTVGLTGNGSSSATLTLSVTSLSLGTVPVGSTSAASTVTLTNHQSSAVAFTAVTASVAFAISSNTCGASLASGSSCAVGVTFSPTAVGAATGTLTFTDSAAGSPQRVSLSGTGSSPVTLSPGSLNLGSAAVGATSSPQAVTIKNGGTASVTVGSVSATGDFAATTACASVPAGQSCTVNVTFTPVLAGTRTGTLTVALSTGTQTVSLTGIGTSGSGGAAGVLTLSPATLNFSGYTIGDNPSKTVTVSNTTAASVGIVGIVLTGNSSLTEKTTCGSVLAPGASCSITVTFKPVAYGTFTGVVTLTESSGAADVVSISASSSSDN